LRWLRDPGWQRGLIGICILLLALSHWVVGRNGQHLHNLIYHMNFIPMLAAGMLFGWRAAAVAALATISAESPLAWRYWRDDPIYLADQAGEMAVFGIAGIVVGYMAERSQRHEATLERATHELGKVNSELQQNLERLKKAERMYAVAQLSASLAHEIRNPLAGISGAAGILKRGNAGRENVHECLEIIDRESQRLNKLLTNFLNFARPRAPRFQPADLVAVIDSVIALAGRSPEARAIEFRRTVDDVLPEVQCDSEQLKQVLLNLVMNAVDATRQGIVHLHAYSRHGTASIEVRDEGCGIPVGQQDRIFDPFFTTKDNGTGLGLAIASTIVEQHGGTLTAANAPGKGLIMVVQLPVSREVTG